MKHILIIEDDLSIGNLLEEALLREGYRVTRAYSGTEALLALELKQSRPDLVLLDLMLPGLSGEEVLPRIREIPVIVLSAKADVEHKAELLLEGAADYITKPFEMRELLARIVVALRRTSAPSSVLSCGTLRLDPERHMAEASGVPVRLTPTECAILKLLLGSPSQVFPKSLLLERIGADTPDCTESSLKMHISNLRRKLRQADGRDYIEAVWGIGFKLRQD